jgi:diaminopimelate epimerase
MGIPFRKMHGLGNDFVVFDARNGGFAPSAADSIALTDRRTGIGCDTIVIMELAEEADVRVRFISPDGTEAATCGNGSRCVAALLFAESGRDTARILTGGGLLGCWRAGNDVSVDMGAPKVDWREIPLAEPADTLHLPFVNAPLSDPVGVSMGNPHAVFFVADAESIDLAEIGPRVEHAPLFPERVNVEIAQVLAPDRIRMRVWERGVGITRACGSGACATLVAAVRRGLTDRKAVLALDGGELAIEWRGDGHVIMTGPVATSFTGEIDERLLPSLALAA